MKVYLSRDEYNNNITPTYCRDDEFSLDDDVTLRFSEPNFGQLIIEGDPLKVIAILQDIALAKSKQRFWSGGSKLNQEEVIWELTRNLSVVFDRQAQEHLARIKVSDECKLYQIVCRITSCALRDGQRTVSKDYLDSLPLARLIEQQTEAEQDAP
jgi:hypothetical protein